MGNSISWSEKLSTGHSFMDLGYRDYVAARFLLNNDLIIQGLSLASTAVEKYLKAIIVFNLKERESIYFHFDRFKEIKNLLQKVNCDITEEFDSVFLEILENAYKIRYYDKLEEPIYMGFYINQLIGELDYTINHVERFITNSLNLGGPLSAYNRAIRNKDVHLLENNFILNKVDKKSFMEEPSVGFSIYIQMGKVVQSEKIVKGGSAKNKYEGQIAKFTEFNQSLDDLI